MTDATKTDATKADATKTVPLIDGELYVVRNGRLHKIDRSNDLPKVEISDDAKDALRALQRRCRRLLRGFRPDIALVASALIEYAAGLPEPQPLEIVDIYARKLGIGLVEPPPGAHVINM